MTSRLIPNTATSNEQNSTLGVTGLAPPSGPFLTLEDLPSQT